MVGKQLQVVLRLFRTYILQQNWSLLEEHEILNGIQLCITDGITSLIINCYTNGNALIQGPSGALNANIQNWWHLQRTSSASPLFEEAELSVSVRAIVEAFRTFALCQGWIPSGRMMHNNIYQVRLTSGSITVPINIYPTNTVLIQGRPCEMRCNLEQWWRYQQPIPSASSSIWEQIPTSIEPSPEPTPLSSVSPSYKPEKKMVPHIGTYDVGKDDYFGPLVVAGIYVDEYTASQLLAIGVCEKKQISDTLLLSLAEEIKRICRGQGHILTYSPERYNLLYKQVPHPNHLRAKAHVQVIANLQKRGSASLALIHQFDDASLVPTILRKISCYITLEQRFHAEDDIAVASASIIAHAEFVMQMVELSKIVGTPLPRGTSNSEIIGIKHRILSQSGQKTLEKIAKISLKTRETFL